jgi:signal transduction histidine kinase
MKRLDENIRMVEHTNMVLLTLEELNSMMNSNSTILRTAMLLRSSNQMTDVLIGNVRMNIKADSLIALTRENTEQHERAISFKNVMEKRDQLIRDSIFPRFMNANMEENTLLLESIGRVRAPYDDLYHELRGAEQRTLAKVQLSKNTFERFTNPILIILLSFSLLLIVSTFLYMMSSLRRRVQLQQELRAKVNSLNRANRELENLTRVTSHHIQEPMRKIRNFASLLEKRIGAIPVAEAREIVGKIEGNASSLQQLANNLVQYGNLIQDQPRKETVDLNEVVAEVENRLEDLLYETKAEIRRSHLPRVDGIPYQLYILFEELITNSIRFTRSEDIPHIEILEWDSPRTDVLILAVRDRGIGFSQDYAERIFRLFEQLEPRSSPGKGIGLAMCSRIMLNHGGTIWAEGKPGAGATFFLEFPRETTS